MKKQIDPNLENFSEDIIDEISKEVEGVSASNKTKKPIDPQLNIKIKDVYGDDGQEMKIVEQKAFDLNNSNQSSKTPESENHQEHHSEHHHSEHHHSEHHHSEHHHSEHHHSEHHHSEHHHSEHHHSEHHHSHHDDEEEEKKKKKILPIIIRIILVIVSILLIIALIAGSTFLILTKKGENDIKSSNKIVIEDNEYNETIKYNGKNYVYDDDVVTFAFLGIDQKDFKTSEQTNYVGSADTDLVIAINTKDGKVDIIAIPRDSMVDIDIYNNEGQFLHTENMQLCLAYKFGNGGEQSSTNVTKAMSRILGVPVEKYFTLDLRGIAPLNDAVGGIKLESKFDFVQDFGLDIHVGDEIELKGELAEIYVRARSSDNVNASLGRTERQIQYIKAYSERLLPAVKDDFSTISKLYNTAQQYSQTNITLENITYIASILLSKNITEFETHTLKGQMRPAPVVMREDDIYAEYILDEQSKTELVLDIFYDEVG